MSNSSLVVYTKLSPNYSTRNHNIDKITIHHCACVNASLEGVGNTFANSARQASSNYGVDSNGRVGMYVEEKNRAWTSSNRENDMRAVTIEVANSKGSPNWEVSDKALAATINLCVDICKRNGIKKLVYDGTKNGSLTTHDMFANTNCPGAYLKSKMSYIANEVNKKLNSNSSSTTTVPPTVNNVDNSSKKSVEEVAKEVIAGKWGNGDDRKKRLAAAGYDYSTVQAKVNSLLSGNTTSKPQKSIDTLAREVINGVWGNGTDRKNRLTAAGYDYAAVQKRVNQLLS